MFPFILTSWVSLYSKNSDVYVVNLSVVVVEL